MWQDKLKEVIYILENSNMNEIDVTFWGRRFRVVKSAGVNIGSSDSNVVYSSKLDNKSMSEMTEDKLDIPQSRGEEILSPMPGTYYSASSPESAPFLKEGDLVSKGEPLCIIEAMKIMNEIEAEQSGTITKILIENGQAVDYNQPLFLIEPS